MLTRRTTFKLYPTPAQAAQLFEWRRLHAYMYNAALLNRRTQYKQFEHSVDYFRAAKHSNSKFQDTDIVKRHESCLVHEPVTRQEVLLRMGLVDFD